MNDSVPVNQATHEDPPVPLAWIKPGRASRATAMRFAESCSVVCMTVHFHLFEAYLKCPTKCFLRSLGETGTGNAYADWVQAQNTSYRSEGIRRLKERVAEQ